MPDVPKWRHFLRFWRADVDADIDDELRFHFEQRIEDLRARGHSAQDATRIAHEEFGDEAATRRGLREIGERVERRRERMRWWRQLLADLRYVLRGLRRTPTFTAGVVLTLAIGIGAAASMYGTMRRLLLEPPPHVAAADRVARPYFHYERAGDSARTFDQLSYPFYERVRTEARTLAGVAAYSPGNSLTVGVGADARMVHATFVSAGFWRTLGTRPALGRFIADDEAHPATGARVVVLGHAFWQRRFGGDPAVVGTTLHVKGLPYRVVGVAPRGFRGVDLTDTDVWLPLFTEADGQGRPATWHTFASSSNLKFVVRPRPDVPPARVAAELSRLQKLLVEEEDRTFPSQYRSHFRTHVSLGPLTGAAGFDGRRIPEATVAAWLVGVAGVLLAIACANVASLLLLRALRRRREIAVRLALGMSRRRLAALLFVESAALALSGGVAAAMVIAVGGAWVRRVLLPGMIAESAGVDWHTVALFAGTVVAAAVLTGLVPVLQTRRDVAAGLRDGAQHGATRRSSLYRGLLVSQSALSAVLLVGAGLFVRSLHRVTTMDLGLDPDHSFVVRIDFTGTGRPGPDVMAFHERALERLRAVPGVRSASVSVSAPLRTAQGGSFRLQPAGEVLSTSKGVPFVNYVSDGFFDASGMRIASGRGFLPADRGGAPVVVVNEALARVAWPGRSPLGECVYPTWAPDACARVVGVVRNAHTFQIREDQRLWLYVPLDPTDVGDRVLLVRAAPGARGMERTVERVLRELDPGLPYVDVHRLGDALDPQIRPWRIGAAVFTAFGALAALLAALGLYAAVAYAVAQRTREIGVRIALGAARPAVARLVVGDGLRIAAVGVGMGLVLALVGARWVADLLFDTSPREPTVIAAVAVSLLGVAAAASLVPARRATRVNPTEALRAD
ncbi:permease [Gemmatirosa kalamazoonensis]|uniref:Permease n=1 Tax=Gemmatirosa kalamazoonensis TaxID=861299 RepID=W0RCM9_9BACT|nr:ADOP family duplicated permease [Gemmatirosa kalamazoonensis]AHG88864.1 permease [Gemmatirosa kalamazoonensis]